MAIVACVVEWSPLSVVEGHDVCASAKEKLNTLLASLLASKLKRGALLLIFCFHVGSMLEESGNDVWMFHQGCEMERCLELVGEGVDVCLGLNEKVNRLEISIVGSVMESSPSIGVNDVDVCVLREDRFEHFFLFTLVVLGQNGFMDWSLSDN